MTHKQKVKKARRMLSNLEIKMHTSLFASKQWWSQKNIRHKNQVFDALK